MTPRISDRPLPVPPSRLSYVSRPATSPLRQDVIARGKELASDPNYPSFEICRKVAETMVSQSVEAPERAFESR